MRHTIIAFFFGGCACLASASRLAAEVEWRFYSLPANLEMGIPENWVPARGTGESDALAEKLTEDAPKHQSEYSSQKKLWLAAYDSRGVSMANVIITQVSHKNDDDRDIKTQAYFRRLNEDPILRKKLIEARDTTLRTQTEVSMAYLGVSPKWLGSTIEQVGDVLGFVSQYDWVLSKKIGALESKEVFSVVETNFWNEGETCTIRFEYSKDFPQMEAVRDVMLSTLKVRATE